MVNHAKYMELLTYLEKLDSVLVAFSGGVDSSLLLAASVDALGKERVLALTATSPFHLPEDLDSARSLADVLGARLQVVDSKVMSNPEFLSNPPERCYFCKKELLGVLLETSRRQGIAHVLEGSNLSDLKDFRPGFRAVREAGVLSPLLEVGMTKEDVREAARERGIASWNRPSEACLCTRIPFGEAITPDRLQRIYSAEVILKSMGIGTVRVRDHGDVARLEVSAEDIGKICQENNRVIIAERLVKIGYKHVAVDLVGYRTGSMNAG